MLLMNVEVLKDCLQGEIHQMNEWLVAHLYLILQQQLTSVMRIMN